MTIDKRFKLRAAVAATAAIVRRVVSHCPMIVLSFAAVAATAAIVRRNGFLYKQIQLDGRSRRDCGNREAVQPELCEPHHARSRSRRDCGNREAVAPVRYFSGFC